MFTCIKCINILAFIGLYALVPLAQAQPYRPHNDNEILEKVVRRDDAAATQARVMRLQLLQQPNNLAMALQLAKNNIEQSRMESDPRLLGHAQAMLAPWWNLAQPPVDVLVVRATIRSGLHEFESALADLSLVLKQRPDHAQARLTRANLLQLRGRYDEARRDCLVLLRVQATLAGSVCMASVASLTGQAEQAYALLNRTLADAGTTQPAIQQWIHGVLAEIAVRRGDARAAEAHFQAALGHGRADAYLLGAYADFLLDENRPREVVALLSEHSRADGLLLRLALAEQRLHSPALATHVAQIEARFAAARQRADNRHRREEARFLLAFRQRPAEALALAQRNWEEQHEPADARLMLEAALAAAAPQHARTVLEWLQRTGMQDRQIAALVARFPAVIS